MTRSTAPGPRGLLHQKPGNARPGHSRHLPAEPLRAFVEHYWIVRWDLRGLAPCLAETLPHPSVHWITELGRSTVHGVPTGRFTRMLEGRGHVFGVKFRPGGFYPFLGTPLSAFAGEALSLATVFGVAGRSIEKALVSLDVQSLRVRGRSLPGGQAEDDAKIDGQMMDLAERFLLARLPESDARLELVTRIVTAIVAGPEITRVEQVADRFDMSKRALQRLFSQYVGVSPKWVIKRYRLHEAVARVAAGKRVNWSRFALDLGYFDQAHFIKDFKALIGQRPAEYARNLQQ